MDATTRRTNLSDAQIRAIIDDTERQALGGVGRAVARAGLGTMAIVLAVFASTSSHTAGIFLLCGVFILGLAAYIRSVARSISMKPRVSAQPAQQEAAPPETTPVTTASPETVSATPAVPAAAFAGIAGGAWSRLSQKQEV